MEDKNTNTNTKTGGNEKHVHVVMPHLSAKSSKGVLCAYRVAPGDAVRKGDIVAEIETDKVVCEIESLYDGTVGALSREEGDEVAEGEALLDVVEVGE